MFFFISHALKFKYPLRYYKGFLNPKIHYQVHKSRHLSLFWTIWVYSTPSHSTSFNIILQSTPLCSKLSVSLKFSIGNEFVFSHMIRPSHPPRMKKSSNDFWSIHCRPRSWFLYSERKPSVSFICRNTAFWLCYFVTCSMLNTFCGFSSYLTGNTLSIYFMLDVQLLLSQGVLHR